jgi:hypothetical protein
VLKAGFLQHIRWIRLIRLIRLTHWKQKEMTKRIPSGLALFQADWERKFFGLWLSILDF